MGKRRCLIIGGGELRFNPATRLDMKLFHIVCADSGADHAAKYQIKPDVICGDMDSINLQNLEYFEGLGVEILKFPVKKDLTDLEIAIQYAIEHDYVEIVCVALDGNRIDHQLTNYLMLSMYANQISLRILSEKHEAYYINTSFPKLTIEGVGGRYISFLPLEKTKGISYEGMQYPLKDDALNLGSTRGMSNMAETNSVVIHIKTGNALIFVNE